ncbi:MAG TPA: bacteriohemerythrin [Clostridia bacterium]|nr:bacteriohemerythrin [Clostridia bacterium]
METAVALFEWTAKYSVGVERFDEEHKRLFNLMNKLHYAMRIAQERTVLEGALLDYTEQHFSAEETAMNIPGFPGAGAHKAEHDRLRSDAAALQEKYRAGASKIGIDLVDIRNSLLPEG